MSSQDKMLALLDAFSVEAPVWSAEELAARFELPASTCYRYLKSLHQAGLLARVGSGSYVVGPRVLALDRIARLSDPVYSVGSPVVAALSRRTGYSALLSVLYSDSVMCVQQVATDDAPPGLFGRGQQRPLVAGATANIILAHLPPHQLRSVFQKQQANIASAGLGKDWDTLRARLAEIRQQGYAYSAGEYRAGIAGLAAPLFNKDGEVLGSIALATSTKSPQLSAFKAQAPAVIKAAAEISRGIAASSQVVDLPARALG
ncbi:IclR family transcriptional regulator [Ramlibacter ginsenosidimutans]|uniref:IclR family transcriptional regulator n=1 Tax=Ramlibacter ginsenosidimutans TaxID=502333 RepID=A0A934TT27_9BURK|nr:IclR family transcriptional regulator [Ramlibacter ginsenosidimutans]MBK6007047.1 IclR family transcriptional regulator [Ramlibacter ginsenosidimutans]